MTLFEHAKSRDNNFYLIRFLAAVAVLVVHSPTLLGHADSLGLLRPLGDISVNIFFLTSGFLITGSLLARKNIVEFACARALRIFPALWAMLLVTVIGLGLFVGRLPAAEFFASPLTHDYFTRCATLINGIRYELPGVFETNPYPFAVNGSLWTLPIEWRLYEYLAGGWVLLALKRNWRLPVFRFGLPVIAALLLLQAWREHEILALPAETSVNLFMFVYGACFYLWRRHVALSLPRFLVLAAIFALAAFDPRLFFVANLLTLAPLTLHLAYLFGGKIRAFNRLGDYSYGLYIYAFPVQQALVALYPGLSLAQMILFSLLSTLAFAVASWHGLEKRALAYKSDVAAATRRLLDFGRDRFAPLRAGRGAENRTP
jgi:peptidoglycan/LPS O-acetylase OafA/YrhL